MKNLISISLLIIYLFGNTEFNQVLEIPELLSHYKQHHTVNHEITFVSFLVMHYCTDDGVTTDDAEDSKLPFKQIQRFGFVFFTTPSLQNLTERKDGFIEKTINNQFSSQHIAAIYPNKHKHPPRFNS